MRPLLPALCVALALPLVVAAQGSHGAKSLTGAAAFSPARLARIDSLMLRLVADRRIPGAVAMIVKDGQVVYHKAFGMRTAGTNTPMRSTDIFQIASQTKAITSLAAMILWEEGKFSLDDPVGRYLPEFREHTVLKTFNPKDSTYEATATRRRITIRQLFTHTSGLDYADIGSEEFQAIYGKAGISALGRQGDVLADKMAALARLPLRYEPGERFNYSLGVDLLGRLVEVWSGMSLDRFFRTRIFEPLKMTDTWFELPADRRDRLVPLHRVVDGVVEGMATPERGVNPDFAARKVTYFSGGGGLSSTTTDYARFLQLFLNGGELDGARLISRKTVELMLTNQIPTLTTAFGLGFALETPQNDFRSVLTTGTFSWGGAFATDYWADPKENLIGQLYTSVFDLTVPFSNPFKVLVYSALK
ncbi:MAG: beta-lactamase family protein [Cytophagaceae bacterium]|nr:beta-lactamase family protein [Gemmatimonadaceae bacterium]